MSRNTKRTIRRTRGALLALGICAVPLLAACGGGSTSADPAAGAPAAASAASSASALTAPVAASALPAQAPPASIIALPTYHMAAVTPPPPSDIDVGGTNASASRPPQSLPIDPDASGIDTTRLTPESLATQLQAIRAARPASVGAAPQGSAKPASSSVYTPAQIRAAYDLPALPASVANLTGAAAAALGAGQTIYIVDAYDDPNALPDLNAFSMTFGLPTCAPVVISSATPLPLAYPSSGCQFVVAYSNASGTMNAGAPAYSSGWSPEISLDVQWSHAIAPLARIVLLESASDSLNDLLGSVLLANKMGAGVLSMSFGAPEGSWVPSADGYFATAGMTYLASTGDSGSQVNWPAVSSNVLAVGGTSLNYSGTGARSETAWSGTGGGISVFEALPAYQSGVNIDGGGTLHSRAVADVAFNADPNTGQYVVITPPGGSAGWYVYGGTSISSPQWAGVLALVNAARVFNGQSVLGDVHTPLYNQVAKVPGNYAVGFDDITSGSDGGCATCTAGVGYDQATGWGTPNFSNLLPLLSSISTLPPLPSATMPTGMAGVAYSIQWPATDSAHGPLVYTLTGAPTGLALGAGATVTWVSPVAGTYSFSVRVQNAAGKTASGNESLTISPAPAAPTVPGGRIVVKTGTVLSQALGVSAPSNSGNLSYALSGAPAGLSVTTAGVLSWAKTVQGSYTFTATATNAYGKSGSGVYTLNVIAEAPPVFTGSTTLSGIVGTAFAASISVSDPNAGALAFTVAGAPTGLAISGGGVLTWAKPVAGIYALHITATDSYGYASTSAYQLNVDGPPVVTGGSLTGNSGAAFSGTVSAIDPIGSALNYSMSGAPSGLSLSSAGALSWLKPVRGSYALTVTARNTAGLSGSGKYTLNIYGPPTLVNANLVGYSTSAFSANLAASDPNGSALHYAMSGAPAGLGLATSGALSWAKPVAGVYKLSVTATDALGLSASAVYTLSIYGTPVLAGGALTGYVGSIFQATLSAKDPNASALSYAMSGNPTGMSLSAAGVLTWTKPVVGTFKLNVTAKDALGLSGSATYTLSVLGPPVIAGGILSAKSTAAFSANVAATDPNASALSYSLLGAPAGMSISAAGVLSWSTPLKGSYVITLVARDALGLSASGKYSLTVS